MPGCLAMRSGASQKGMCRFFFMTAICSWRLSVSCSIFWGEEVVGGFEKRCER